MSFDLNEVPWWIGLPAVLLFVAVLLGVMYRGDRRSARRHEAYRETLYARGPVSRRGGHTVDTGPSEKAEGPASPEGETGP